MEHYGDVNCHIYSEGKIVWAPPTRFIALCNIDLRLWPFDTQKCKLKFSSWSFSGSQIDVAFMNGGTPIENEVHWFFSQIITVQLLSLN